VPSNRNTLHNEISEKWRAHAADVVGCYTIRTYFKIKNNIENQNSNSGPAGSIIIKSATRLPSRIVNSLHKRMKSSINTINMIALTVLFKFLLSASKCPVL
jgi:hypothetical protein